MPRFIPYVLLFAVCLAAVACAKDDPEGKLQVRAIVTGTFTERATCQDSNKVGNVTTGADRVEETWDRVTLVFTSNTKWTYRDGVPVEMVDSAHVSCSGQGGIRYITRYVTAINRNGQWAPYHYAATKDGNWTYSVPSEPRNKGFPPLMAATGSAIVVPPAGMYTLILNPYPNCSDVKAQGSWVERLRPKQAPGNLHADEDKEYPIDDDRNPPGDPRARYLASEAWEAIYQQLKPGSGIQGNWDPEKDSFFTSGHLTDAGGPGTTVTKTDPVNDGDRKSTGLRIVTTQRWTAEVYYSFSYNHSPIEAIIKPVGDYQKWVPEAGTKQGKPGNKVSFNVQLRDKKTGGKPANVTATFHFALQETSTEPGSCLNSPWSDSEPDLKILKSENSGLAKVADDGQSATSKERVTECPVTISCFDGGPHSTLKIIADLSDGRSVVAHLEDGMENLSLPFDEDGNRIADAWEAEKGVKGQSPEVDDEQDPPGDRTNGDGLTLWEEYRGFLEDGKHIRGHVKKKDYFICDTVGGRIKPGIQLFKTVSKLEVHSNLTVEELGIARVVNRNHGERPHVVDQHGILVGQRETDGTCEAISDLEQPSTPKDIREVVIDPKVRSVKTVGGKSYDEISSFVAHELLHACSVWHHGQCDRVVWWRAETIAGGRRQVYEYSSPDDVGHPERGVAISPRRENDTELAASNWDAAKMVWLGMPGGQHSGYEDCIMRYDCSNGYPWGGLRYKLQPAELEVPGFGLCTSTTGTGVNAGDRAPRSRYVDATKGNCVDQIRVKDPF